MQLPYAQKVLEILFQIQADKFVQAILDLRHFVQQFRLIFQKMIALHWNQIVQYV